MGVAFTDHERVCGAHSNPSGAKGLKYVAATNMYQRAYFLNVKGIALEPAISYRKPGDLASLHTAVESIRFDEP